MKQEPHHTEKEVEELLNTKILARAFLVHAFIAGQNKCENSGIKELGDDLEQKIASAIISHTAQALQAEKIRMMENIEKRKCNETFPSIKKQVT